MKELDSFTVERLEELTALSFPPSHHELAALARIALAAKRAEPVDEIAFDMARGIMALVNETNIGGACQLQAKIQCFIEENLTTHPQLNSPQGWIKCSDQMPEDDTLCLGVDECGVIWTMHFDDGEFRADTGDVDDLEISHWMPLPAAPEKENG
ncbi:DUF551 domain-containing protein [Yersinia enterocolitica]|uniref:DUF551 domain-containing protein n=1 Tax=Yersinia enterocolitica TaxID=630 RepID=UPI0028657991|nr:DUF551 domain-containing protein [Yersinia enterocolitica]EKN4145839.1 DUF551 domain-containing protein [Yersinia enterocolitica]HDL6729508.1 DUF551 domain-containing protein [Yersinia enterocolitica]HDL7332753.1 DUF551 domain-containing protein [Yersinia enterocolitica]HDM8349525.1 DUF551 domain-containing protein [Yersinia enterocolitica]